MVDAYELSKDSMDVLSSVFQLGSPYLDACRIIRVSSTLATIFPVVGAILGLVDGFRPDCKHEEILRGFEKLSSKVDQVRYDIKKLSNDIAWDLAQVQYGDVVAPIEMGMRFSMEIGKTRNSEERMIYQEKLRKLCDHEKCSLALASILDGLEGTGLFRLSILDKYYDKTGGNRSELSILAQRLLRVVSGGMLVYSTYETMMHTKDVANKEIQEYNRRFTDACRKVQSVLDKCEERMEENMRNDLNMFLDKGGSNSDLWDEISIFMEYKYDWLEHFLLVYNDLSGFENHCFGGYGISSLHRNGKCGIVFYRTKGEAPRFSNRYDEAYQINDETGCSNAQKGYANIVAKLDQRGIGWSGCAVIKRGPDLWYGGTFSTRDATIVGPRATAIILLE